MNFGYVFTIKYFKNPVSIFYQMEEFSLTTPSLLFSAISLIMLAFTNRFLSYAQVVRSLKTEYEISHSLITAAQIENLRIRLQLTKNMQILGITSLLLCVLSMLFVYIKWDHLAVYCFGIALLLLSISLILSIREILISTKALEIHLEGMSKKTDLPPE